MSWAVICCEPKREAKLAAAISDAGHEVFAPTYTAWRGKFTRYTEIRRPLTPNYIYAILEPHEIHQFHGDGAVRLIQLNWRLSLQLAHKVQAWRDLMDDGVFDDPRPEEPKVKAVSTRRNRKARRQAGETKATRLDFRDGLELILSEMTSAQPVAA